MLKNALIIVLAAAVITFALISMRANRPICDDLIRDEKGELICVLGLGPIKEDEAEVIMVKRIPYTHY